MKNPTLYNMIVQAEDRSRTMVETLICALLILSAVVSIGFAAAQTATVPCRLTTNDVACEYRA